MNRYLIATARCADDHADMPPGLRLELSDAVLTALQDTHAALLALRAGGADVHSIDLNAPVEGVEVARGALGALVTGRGWNSRTVDTVMLATDVSDTAHVTEDADIERGVGEAMELAGIRVRETSVSLFGRGEDLGAEFFSGEVSLSELLAAV